MERRALIALALSFVVFMAFIYYGEKTKRPTAPAPATQTAAGAAGGPGPGRRPRRAPPQPASPPAKAPATRPAKDVVVDTPSFKAVFTELGGRLKSFQLKKYKDRMPFEPIYHFKLGPVGFEVERYLNPAAAGIKPKDLVREGGANELPLTLSWEGKTLNVPGLALCEASTVGPDPPGRRQGHPEIYLRQPRGPDPGQDVHLQGRQLRLRPGGPGDQSYRPAPGWPAQPGPEREFCRGRCRPLPFPRVQRLHQ